MVSIIKKRMGKKESGDAKTSKNEEKTLIEEDPPKVEAGGAIAVDKGVESVHNEHADGIQDIGPLQRQVSSVLLTELTEKELKLNHVTPESTKSDLLSDIRGSSANNADLNHVRRDTKPNLLNQTKLLAQIEGGNQGNAKGKELNHVRRDTKNSILDQTKLLASIQSSTERPELRKVATKVKVSKQAALLLSIAAHPKKVELKKVTTKASKQDLLNQIRANAEVKTKLNHVETKEGFSALMSQVREGKVNVTISQTGFSAHGTNLEDRIKKLENEIDSRAQREIVLLEKIEDLQTEVSDPH
jgi:hypothetical protein